MNINLTSSSERRKDKRVAIYPVSVRIAIPFGNCMGFITDFSLSGSNIWTKADLITDNTYTLSLISQQSLHKQIFVDIKPVWRTQLPSSNCYIYGCHFQNRTEIDQAKINDFLSFLQEDLRYKSDLMALKPVEVISRPLIA